jgi:PAS domain-containing protein
MTDPSPTIHRDTEPAPDAPPAGAGTVPPLFEGFVEDLRLWAHGGRAVTGASLEVAYEELRVTVEHLRATSSALLESRARIEAVERLYRDLFEDAPDPYLVTDLHGTVREANRAACATLNIDHR